MSVQTVGEIMTVAEMVEEVSKPAHVVIPA